MMFSKLYSGLIGGSIIVQWTTAALLMISAWGLHKQAAWGRKLALISTGMLFYTALVSPGYFAQQGNWIWLGFFGVILLGGVASVCQVAQD